MVPERSFAVKVNDNMFADYIEVNIDDNHFSTVTVTKGGKRKTWALGSCPKPIAVLVLRGWEYVKTKTVNTKE